MAQFCPECGTKYANEDAKYCHNRGEKAPEILSNNDDERNYIEYYFHLGYKYDDIVNLMEIYHGILISVCTLRRRLQKYGLKKKNSNIDEHELKSIIKKEMEGTGQLSGYRKIWHILRINHHIHAPRNLVAQIVHDIDPEASKQRKGNKLKRRKYMSYGPNHCWHIDGYDKLKPFGFPVHAAIDGFSRKVLWLDVCRSNNSPTEPTKLYLECVSEHGGAPLFTRRDYETENGQIAAIQCYFQSDDEAHKYGTSTRNQRIENWWSHFRKSCGGWWINFFKDLQDVGTFDLERKLHKECLWFCFQGVIQASLDKMKEYWNTHYIRSSRHETIPGVPDILFFLPENSGGVNCLVPVSSDKVLEMKLQHYEETEGANTYQEYFQYVIDLEGLTYPDSPNEAVMLFSYLAEKAGEDVHVFSDDEN